ncbi:P-loop containing nucleoside triphosphate hydrolase protein [Thozetella sp. PMI_491]|nr:P-loop containing nucleoside triphosphate hydrolase protein [Thozetella sp. PMI_491]
MGSLELNNFFRQTWALTKKNILIAVVRHPVSTFFRALVLPIAFLVLLLEVETFLGDTGTFGIGNSPSPIQPLHNGLLGSQDLILVAPQGLGPDVDIVIQKITSLLGTASQQIVYLRNETDLLLHCPVNLHGTSGCFGAVVFNDSPLTKGGSQTWSYTIRTDPIKTGYPFDVFSTNNQEDVLYLPLQLAVENAITNSSAVPETYMFTHRTQTQADVFTREHWLGLVINTYSIAMFIAMMSAVFHVVSMITTERDAGMSQLIDVMGGSAAARVLSYVLAFDLIYFPCWLVSGILYWNLLFPLSNIAVSLFWQILTGWALTSASIFAAAFLSGMILNSPGSGAATPTTTTVSALSLLFPSFNYMFTIGYYARYEIPGIPIDLLHPPPSTAEQPVISQLPALAMWMFLVVQIVIYPILAVVFESMLHGVSFKSRTFDTSQEATDSVVALRTSGLGKVYVTPWYKRLLGGGHSSDVNALEDLELICQRRQILCLLGANGSGKTTTLDLISGIQAPTSGSVTINAARPHLGVCPQRNVLFNHLTVFEHVWVWSKIKGGKEDHEAIERLIEACDLTRKRDSRAGNLSGGQKRKLQLACTFVGETTLCLMDEVTTGLDPLSRRRIWNVILAERSKRSMIITTHFLDESEVLADTITIISRGHLKCQGPPAVLKSQQGGGYRVHAPYAHHATRIDGISSFVHQDRIVYNTPDSTAAARLISTLTHRGETDVQVTGPTIEDVFMKVSDELPETFSDDPTVHESKAVDGSGQLSHAQPASFWTQFQVLLRKRVIILRRRWWPHFFAFALPIAVTPALDRFLEFYHTPNCIDILADAYKPTPFRLGPGPLLSSDSLTTPTEIVAGPLNENTTIYNVTANYPIGEGYNLAAYPSQFIFRNNFGQFQDFVRGSSVNITPGAIWMGDGSSQPTLAYDAELGMYPALVMLNLWSQVRSGVKIDGAHQFLSSLFSVSPGRGPLSQTYFCLVQAVYPALFALYPTYERIRRVRALQYSNGIRSLPMWIAYVVFDAAFIVVISACATITTWKEIPYWYSVGYFFPVLALYGLAALLMGLVISTMAKSQLAAFAFSVGIMAVMLALLTMTLALELAFTPAGSLQSTEDATTFTLGLIFPIGNVFRAILVGLNIYLAACHNNVQVAYPGSIYAYGSPILYLIIQIIFLFALLLWLDRGEISIFPHNTARVGGSIRDAEESAIQGPHPSVAAEAQRTEESEADLLRLLHVTKSFGTMTAVDDVSLGLGNGEILALLGPNGAGKTTIVNLIRGELNADHGRILVKGVEVRGRVGEAQRYLGVCPQFDALDPMTVREHLFFYCRAKGIASVAADVDLVMAKMGLEAYADRLAAKLSGGNKRKLSLAIALLGNPDILLLDEPSSSMDVISKRTMWRTLAAIAPGRSLLLTTHSMEEADALATRAAILSRRLLAIGSTQALRAAYSAQHHISLILATAPLSDPEEVQLLEDWVRRELGPAGALLDGESLGGQVRFSVPVDQGVGSVAVGGIAAIIEKLEASKKDLGIGYYAVGSATLEWVFMNVVTDNHVLEEDEKSIQTLHPKITESEATTSQSERPSHH